VPATGTTRPPAIDPPPDEAGWTASRAMQHLLESAARRSAEGRPPRVLLTGPVAQVTMDSIAGAGCRLTVEGEFFPELPLAYPDDRFDLILGLDVLDLLPDDRARAQAAEWARVLAPGGSLYLVARRDPSQVPPLVRIDIHPGGGLTMHPLGERHALVQPRQNREFEVLVRPLAVHEISLRRDGLREILCRKQG
jgi:SAM-dependent methyltransferase